MQVNFIVYSTSVYWIFNKGKTTVSIANTTAYLQYVSDSFKFLICINSFTLHKLSTSTIPILQKNWGLESLSTAYR